MYKNKAAVYAFASFVVLSIIGGILWNNHVEKQNYIKEQESIYSLCLDALNEKYENDFKFEGAKDIKEGEEGYKPAKTYEEKIECLKYFIDEKNIVDSNDSEKMKGKPYEKLDDEKLSKYSEDLDAIISESKESLKNYYIAEINKNKIGDLNASSKEDLKQKSENLSNILKQIEVGKDIVCNDDEFKNFQKEIEELKSSYDTKVKEIEEKEAAEQKAKEEAERKAKEEAERKANQNSSSSSSSSENSSSNSSSSNGKAGNNSNNSNSNSGGSSGRYIVRWQSYTTYEGTTYTYWYSDGSVWYKDYDGSMHDITNDPDIWG